MNRNGLGRLFLIAFFGIIIILSFGFVIWNFGGEKIAFRLGIGEQVKIYKYSSYQWRGQEDYIKHKVEELIIISRELGIFDESILPIQLSVRSLNRIRSVAGAERTRFKSYIVFDNKHLEMIGREDLDGDIVHEFSHLLDWDKGHTLIWKTNCRLLFDKTISKKRELSNFNSWIIRSDPCME